MSFNSVYFLIFFPAVFILYYALPFKARKIFLLISNFVFYSIGIPLYLFILIYIILVNYFFAGLIRRFESNAKKYLWIGIFLNIIILLFFKYFNFLNYNVSEIASLIHWNYSVRLLEFLIPVGISFYIFKGISFLIETYRKNINQVSILNLSLYISYFPELLAGPIDKPQQLIPQFDVNQKFNYENVTDGFKIITWGFFKKLVIADRLAVLVNQVFNNASNFEGISLAIAVLFFSVQIYCDFSGYSDIAYGISLALGFKIVKNFERPYFSKSISDFWKRWHISLSFWLRDYIFLPVAYSLTRRLQNKSFKKYLRADKLSYYIASLITMTICGLWHGASWGFILWGGFHGLFLALSLATKNVRKKITKFIRLSNYPVIHNIIRMLFIFAIVSLLWILFRANTLTEAVLIYKNLFIGWNNFVIGLTNPSFLRSIFGAFGITENEFYISMIAILVLMFVEIIQTKYNIIDYLKNKNVFVRWSVYYAVIIIIVFYGAFNSSQGFIYMQF